MILQFEHPKSEVQHNHILVKFEIEKFTELLADFHSNPDNASNRLLDLINEVKMKAKVTEVTLLVHNFKSFMK